MFAFTTRAVQHTAIHTTAAITRSPAKSPTSTICSLNVCKLLQLHPYTNTHIEFFVYDFDSACNWPGEVVFRSIYIH